ncbi:MAG TPA: ABC transporter ATP-binding protein [Cellvibrionaceae bacterium]
MTAMIQATGLGKHYGRKKVLDHINLDIPAGRIVGVIGPNGAGKTTLLQALLGLKSVHGSIRMAGFNPQSDRVKMQEQVCFIADTAILPSWMKVSQLLDYTAAVHPNFNRERARGFLADTRINHKSRVKELSKGMVTQLHLALVMAIDAKILILDEPTLGLDIIYRKTFYDTLLNDYYDAEKTIIITTHQVEEIEHILTDVIFIDDGQIVLDETTEQMQDKYHAVLVNAEHDAGAQALGPIAVNRSLSGNYYIFENTDRAALEKLGPVHIPDLAELFVAKLGKNTLNKNQEVHGE